MLQELLKAFILIFIAEMGDKTQILAMAFATRFKVKKVLLGIFLGVLLNHGLAVMLGSYISTFIPINTVQIVAGIAFVGFSLWTLKSEDDEDEEEETKSKFGPVLTVALAFFIGELGDKTQLTAITLATDARYPLFILCGTVLGMVVTGGIGIIIGKKLGDKIPEFAVKIIAAAVFMFFGISKLYRTLPKQYITLQNSLIFVAVIGIAIFMIIRPTIKRRKEGKESLFKAQSRKIYNYYQQAEKDINQVCLGVDTCGTCNGSRCMVGSIKQLIKKGLDEKKSMELEEVWPQKQLITKGYDNERVLELLSVTLGLLKSSPNQNEYENIHEIRKKLEIILFNQSIDYIDSWDDYQKRLNDIDTNSAAKIFKAFNH